MCVSARKGDRTQIDGEPRCNLLIRPPGSKAKEGGGKTHVLASIEVAVDNHKRVVVLVGLAEDASLLSKDSLEMEWDRVKGAVPE